MKAGFRFQRDAGGRLNPEIPKFIYNNYADLLANIPREQNTSYGAPPHKSHMDNYSVFVQDDWRVGNNFVLNLGLRYDYYGTVEVLANHAGRSRDRQLRGADRPAQARLRRAEEIRSNRMSRME